MRTILYNYLFARQRGGRLILRIEDTDQERLVPTAIDSIYEGLHWLGITWDEGPREGGPHAPYVQSERLPLYKQHVDALLSMGASYPCFCTEQRLKEMRSQQQARGELTRYDRLCRWIPSEQAAARVAAGESHTIRLKVPEEGEIGVRDLVHGERRWPLKAIEDQILLKSDGFPTYHLAVVVDDHVMKITHVLRGDEWFASLPKHLLLYRAFSWELPEFAHLPDVLGPDHKKLSKRHGSTAVKEFREQGYLPEGLINFLALIGWAPGTEDEVFSLADLIERWRLEQVQESPGLWDKKRLDHFDGIHIRRLSPGDFLRRLGPYLPPEAPEELVRAAAPLAQERIKTLAEARDLLDFFFTDRLDYSPDMLVGKRHTATETKAALQRGADILERATDFSHITLEPALRALAADLGWSAADLFMALRVAITGRTVTPPLIESIVVLGRERAAGRLRDAARRLQLAA